MLIGQNNKNTSKGIFANFSISSLSILVPIIANNQNCHVKIPKTIYIKIIVIIAKKFIITPTPPLQLFRIIYYILKEPPVFGRFSREINLSQPVQIQSLPTICGPPSREDNSEQSVKLNSPPIS